MIPALLNPVATLERLSPPDQFVVVTLAFLLLFWWLIVRDILEWRRPS